MKNNFCKGKTGIVLTALLALVFVFGLTVLGDNTENQPSQNQAFQKGNETELTSPAIIVNGRYDSLIGIADTASQGTVGADELKQRTLSRPGEVLETVPGIMATQHSGGGKANQFFLRGFNLDHGTDFATTLDGVPVNLPTHAHGQGYTDLNIIIPELVERVNYRKGVYFADLGDFSSAGGADMQYFDSLAQSIAQIQYGSFNYWRGLFASSVNIYSGSLLYALELFRYDGPWTIPDDYRKINGVLRYSSGNAGNGYSITAMIYSGTWNATDQIASRALNETPGFGLYDSLDPGDGGNSHRCSLSAEWHKADADTAAKVLLYGFYYDMDLFSNFTYYLNSPQGDQMEQQDKRWVGGTKASNTWFGQVGNMAMENTAGLQIRSDSINNGLYQTVNRARTDKYSYDGATIPAVICSDAVWEASVAPYFENKTQWMDKIRSILGLRWDYYHFDVDANLPVNSGTQNAQLASPKGSLVFGPWANTEYYLSGGLGYHSNDGRGVTEKIDPSSGDIVTPATALVRTSGAEIGVRTVAVQGLQSTLAVWLLNIDSELVFDGDHGTTAPSAPSQRYGIEWSNYYTLNRWLDVDADFSFSHAMFTQTVYDDDTGISGRYIPEAVNSVVAAGISCHQPEEYGFFSELRLRFFGPRPLTEDDSVQSGSTILLSAKAGYNFNKNWTLSIEGFNLLNRKDHDIDYYYPSRLENEAAGPDNGGYNDIHFKPVEPLSFRLELTAKF
jgi:outer membrane receptor protein involved in Fe transport